MRSLCILAGLVSVALGTFQSTTFVLSSRRLHSVPGRVLRKRGLSQSSIPLQDYFNGTDLQWYGQVQVGTPPQNFTVVFDTGSATFEIPGKNCTAACANQRTFDFDKSSTYKFIDDGEGLTLQFSTGVGVDPVEDLNQWVMTGFEVSDTVTIGGLTATNVPFYLIDNQTAAFSPDPFDGIMGLASESGSFFKALIDQGLPPFLGFFFARNASGELTLGGVDTSKFNSTMVYAAVEQNQGFWTLRSSGLAVNGRTTGLQQSFDIVFDSGTSNAVFPQNITEAIYALISPDIKANPNEPGTYGIACSKIDSLEAVIDLTLTSTSSKPFNLTVPSSELNLGPFRTDTSLCQTMINAWGSSVDFQPVIGGSLMKHYYTTWNVGNSSLGFAALSSDSSSNTANTPQSTSAASRSRATVTLLCMICLVSLNIISS